MCVPSSSAVTKTSTAEKNTCFSFDLSFKRTHKKKNKNLNEITTTEFQNPSGN